jgi:Xaa-Pro aminopeptidase
MLSFNNHFQETCEATEMQTLVQEKVNQAIAILQELDIDLWLTFVRETSAGGDPVLPLIYGLDLTWQSALMLSKNGECIAIVGRFEAEAARRTGAYPTVIQYDKSIQNELLGQLIRLDPRQIAINYSIDDVHADGLTFGMYQLLCSYLDTTPFQSRLTSAEKIHRALRGRKTLQEIERVRRAIQTTNAIFERTFKFIQVGMTEVQVSDFMHSQLDELNLGPAWEYINCPTVNCGPESSVGHVGPTELKIKPGHLVHFDFGVKQDDYCSDIQRVVYFLRPGELLPPVVVQRGFNTVREAIDRSIQAMQPGISGKEIDHIARQTIVNAGYPEYLYATGHQLGRVAHDGAGILGPQWDRYGDTPNYLLEAGQIYTLEPGVNLPDYGYIGLEEDVLVTPDGAVFLGEPQVALIIK